MNKTQILNMVEKVSSSLKTSELKTEGCYPVYGAQGIIGYLDSYQTSKKSIAIIKDGAGVGRVQVVPEFSSVLGTLQLLIPKEGYDVNYLYYLFESLRLGESYSGATIPHIYFKDYGKRMININDAVSQEIISNNLGIIRSLINKSEDEIRLLDELTKSRFNELFMHNGYPKVRLEQLSSSKGEYGAGSASAEFDDTRPRYVRITDINDDGTLNDDYVCSKILTDDNEYKLKYGDFLFARMGATVGKTYAFLAGNQIYAGYLIRYRLILSKINPIYLFWYTRQNEYWDWVRLKQSGSAQPGINAKKFDSLEIPLAPIDKQNQFALFVEQADKLKFNVQKRIEKYKELLNKKMDEYFN